MPCDEIAHHTVTLHFAVVAGGVGEGFHPTNN
jgi:hypothetical protein